MGRPRGPGGIRDPLVEEESVGGDAERRVMVEAAPAAAFVMAEPEILLAVAVVALDPPAEPGEMNEALQGGVLGQVREPVLSRLGFVFGPFDQEPFLWPVHETLPIAIGRDAQGGNERAEGFGLARAPGDLPPARRAQALGQRPGEDRRAIPRPPQPGA